MKTIKGVVFDLYGTLYDVHSVAGLCEVHFPGHGRDISTLWRQKQLEYTWLRSLMDSPYVDFEKTTLDALVYTCHYLKLTLTEPIRSELCEAYLKLTPYPEVPQALAGLQAMGLPLAILSNGSTNSIRRVVAHSGLQERFNHLISADCAQIFKPHKDVYLLGETHLKLHRREILFVSSNAWDASGAKHFGYAVCWINRNGNTFDELGQTPDHIVKGVDELVPLIA